MFGSGQVRLVSTLGGRIKMLPRVLRWDFSSPKNLLLSLAVVIVVVSV